LLWSAEELIDQRERLIALVEAAAQRSGAEILIVFDGADVVGAHASRRRMIRVIYSTEGALADDLIRDEVKRTPSDRAIVVVTNDAEVIKDVRAMGANTVASERFAKWCRG
jgi:predicted RNA-binding protein with PIN domain